MSHSPSIENFPQPLSGGKLALGAILLATANFLAILDTTIANVSVSNIAGSLGTSTSQGTYVITSYAVAEAISVPLTGWLASRFGSMRVFVTCLIMFGVFSALCGMATSMNMLVLFRVFLGFSGGPLMPLSQTLMMRIFPKEKKHAAIGIWSMTTLVAPIMGPILGGIFCDQLSWPYIFFVKAPFAIVAGVLCWKLLQQFETKTAKSRMDTVGLVLLVVWVAALQLLLDEGKNLDWFASTQITFLAVVAAIGFAAFLIWELHEPNPIVDLRVFRHRGFTVSVLTISLAFACFFGVSVLTPLWLQSFMGYTATTAGLATAWTGVTAFFVAPMVASSKKDPRLLVFIGVVWLGAVTLWRTVANTDMGFWDVAVPLMVMGFALPFFFIPSTGIALASVDEHEMDSAAGLMNFLRTLSGAFATSLVTTVWSDQTTRNHAELVGLTDRDQSIQNLIAANGATPEAAHQVLDYMVTSQSVMLATNQLMTVIGVLFLLAAAVIWLAPKPGRVIEPGAGGH